MEDISKIKDAMKSGVGFVCSTCDKFWRAKDNGLSSCMAGNVGRFCAGPLGGGAFPEYKGPIKDRLMNFCFVCGSRSDAAVEIGENKRVGSIGGMVGVCSDHIEMLETFSKPAERPVFVSHKEVVILK